MMYSEKTLRRKAHAAGYNIEKSFQHYLSGGVIVAYDGERLTGYNVVDLPSGLVIGGIDAVSDHQWSLEDVEEFLQEVYATAKLPF